MTEGKLKIVFYTDTFLPARDGVVSSILLFKRELAKRGHEVYIFAASDRETQKQISGSRGIYIIPGVKWRRYPQYRLAMAPLATIQKVREINPDVIHAHTPFIMGTWALATAKINKIPIVGTFHTLFTDKTALQQYVTRRFTKRVERLSWRYARFFYNRCDEVTAPSRTIKDILARNRVANISIVPNGVDTARFNPKVKGGSVRRSLQRERGEKIVLYIGRMGREKKIETLLKAAKILKDENIRFVLGGRGPSLEYYRHMAQRLRLANVDFAGFIDDRQLARYYAACDVFCIPSTFETQGIVSLEAMATGKPVVAADSMALREVIKNGKNGEKFKPNDPKSCAAKIKKVIINIDNYRDMRRTAELYSVEKATDELLKVYQKAINDITV